MVIVGLLATLGVAFLPGLAVSLWLPLRSAIQRLLVAFALSLLINHLSVFLFVATGYYSRPVVLVWVGLQLIFLGVSFWLNQRRFHFYRRWPWPIWDWSPRSIAAYILLIFAVISGWAIISRLLAVNPGVFNLWDDLVSFNKWALEWYSGHFPTGTQYYPQLIPTNWSMIYQLTGTTELHFFAKAMMGIFPVFILLAFVDLWQRLRSVAWLAGLSFATVLLIAFANSLIGSGYSDIPVAFMAFLAGYLVFPSLLGKTFDWLSLWLAVVIAAGAALTKQAGLYLIIPMLIWAWAILSRQSVPLRLRIGRVALMSVVFLMIISPWYVYKTLDIRRGGDTAEFGGVNDALVRSAGDRGVVGRIYVATGRTAYALTNQTLRIILPSYGLTSSPNPPGVLVLLISLVWLSLLVWSWRNQLARYVLLTLVLPFYLIWAVAYSYDFRNMIIILPFWGMATGFGLVQLIDKGGLALRDESAGPNSSKVNVERQVGGVPSTWAMIAMVSIGLIWVGYWQWQYPLPKLRSAQEQLMRQVGFPWLNQLLYQYHQTVGLTGKVRTMYTLMEYLPQLKEYAVTSPNTLSFQLLQELEKDPSIHYVLWWDVTTTPDCKTYIQEQVKLENYKQIFNQGGYRFVKIRP